MGESLLTSLLQHVMCFWALLEILASGLIPNTQ